MLPRFLIRGLLGDDAWLCLHCVGTRRLMRVFGWVFALECKNHSGAGYSVRGVHAARRERRRGVGSGTLHPLAVLLPGGGHADSFERFRYRDRSVAADL